MMTTATKKSPSAIAKASGYYDCTGLVGPLFAEHYVNNPPEWPMYSFDRPAYVFWDAVARTLHGKGWTDEEIKTWLQSKGPRWRLDGSWDDALVSLGQELAAELTDEDRTHWK